MKTAAAYVRVSTDDQVEFSPDSQVKALKSYAERNDMILPNEFIFMDEGISGKTTNKRIEFNKMIAIAKSKPKPFDVILVWKYSRFARNREDSVVYKSMLRKDLGIDVISISENVGDDKMSIIFEAMIEAMDEYYSINLAEEVKRGMTEKAKRGGVLSIPPFGYKVENGEFVIVPHEAQIVRKVFNDYINGKGFLSIAKELNSLGIKTHRGNPIESRTIEYWLNNPVYTGKIRWNPKGSTDRNYNSKDLIITNGSHEPIIDLDTWTQVQDKMQRQKQIYRKYRRDSTTLSNWCVGLIRCGVCHGAMSYMAGNFLCCRRGKGLCEGNGSISANKLNNIVIEYLESILTGKIVRINSAKKNTIEQQSNNNSQADLIKTEIARCEFRMQRIKEAFEDGIDSLEEYKENKLKLQEEIKSLKNKLSKELKNADDEKVSKVKIDKSKIKKLVDILKDPTISEQQKNEHARCIIKEIVKTGADGKTIKIVLWE